MSGILGKPGYRPLEGVWTDMGNQGGGFGYGNPMSMHGGYSPAPWDSSVGLSDLGSLTSGSRLGELEAMEARLNQKWGGLGQQNDGGNGFLGMSEGQFATAKAGLGAFQAFQGWQQQKLAREQFNFQRDFALNQFNINKARMDAEIADRAERRKSASGR